MKKKKIILILGSGRSGTYQLYKLFSNIDKLDVKHERIFENMLKIGVKGFHNKLTNEEQNDFLNEYNLLICKSKKNIWIDISNSLPWVASMLIQKFNDVDLKVIHLVRNGKKVVSSFYNKFPDIFYNQEDVNVLNDYIFNNGAEPPADKKYWRPIFISQKKDKFIDLRFENICHYWKQITNLSSAIVKKNKKISCEFRFEDILIDKLKLKKMFEFLEIEYKDEYFYELAKPINVHIAKNFKLNNVELQIFNRICLDQMLKYQYGEEEYAVKY